MGSCTAFQNGIPREILMGSAPHDKPGEYDDHGILWELDPPRSKRLEAWEYFREMKGEEIDVAFDLSSDLRLMPESEGD
jgi:hypothetical protein